MQEWGVLASTTKRVHVLLDSIPDIRASIDGAIMTKNNMHGAKLGMELADAGSVQFLLGDIPCRDPQIIAEYLDKHFTGKFVKKEACDAAYNWSQQQKHLAEADEDASDGDEALKHQIFV